MIAATSNTRMAASPKVEKNSVKPPAIAARPVAFSLEIPRTALETPIAIGRVRKRNGVQARHNSAQKALFAFYVFWLTVHSSRFRPQLIVQALASSDYFRSLAIDKYFRSSAARIVVRPEYRTVCAYVQNRQQITFVDQRKLSVTRKKIAGLADGADYVGNFRCR